MGYDFHRNRNTIHYTVYTNNCIDFFSSYRSIIRYFEISSTT